MPKLRVHNLSMSLDGYVAGPAWRAVIGEQGRRAGVTHVRLARA